MILTILAVPSFAGNWNNISFNEIVRNNHNYLLGEFDSTGTITAMIDQKTWHAGSNQTIHDVWHQSNTLRGHYAYILSFQGSTTRIDGKVAYFK